MASDTLHVDDTPVPVLAPGTGKTKTGRLWTYVRDERPFAGSRPPATLFFYSTDRKGEHPQTHLKDFRGIIHADGYAGFNELFAGGQIAEAACWAHVRRKFMRGRWSALVRCFDDGRLALDNNPAERALRGVAIGRKNWLFAGSDAGGRRAAAMYSLIESAKINGLNPQLYITDLLARIADHPARHIADLLPWNCQPTLINRAAA